MDDKPENDIPSTQAASEPLVDIPAVHLDVLRRTGKPIEWWALLGMAAAELGLLADLVVKREIVDGHERLIKMICASRFDITATPEYERIVIMTKTVLDVAADGLTVRHTMPLASPRSVSHFQCS